MDVLTLLVLVAGLLQSEGDAWTQFRGPTGLDITPEKDLLHWEEVEEA